MKIREIKRIAVSSMLLAAVFIIFASYVFADDPEKAIISSYDAYFVVDNGKTHPVELRAKLEEEGALNINPDIEGEYLSFYIDGKFISKAKTDEDGFARVGLTPKDMKDHELTVKLEVSKEYSAIEDKSLIYFINPEKPTIICDIDWTVSNTDKSSLLLKSKDDESTPLKDSPKVLAKLSEHYNIVFVTGREDALLHKTREWLARWKFPRLPVLFADFGQTPYINQDEYKEKAVAKVKSDIKHVVAGVGDMDYDAKAYLKSGLKTFIINKKDDIPEGAVRVSGWEDIEKELMKEDYTRIK